MGECRVEVLSVEEVEVVVKIGCGFGCFDRVSVDGCHSLLLYFYLLANKVFCGHCRAEPNKYYQSSALD